MNRLERILNTKTTENGDVSYKSTGNNLIDLLFMQSFFEKHLNQVKIGMSEKEKLFAMYMRDPRYGQGRRDLGRVLLKESKVSPNLIVKCGRYDDLWHIPTDENIRYLHDHANETLCKKWLPRLTGKDGSIAKALCKEWKLTEKEYRKLIKVEDTTEYKLSYALADSNGSLNELFNKYEYIHPLVETIDFSKVPSLAMKKYLNVFSTREDIKPRFDKYMQDVKQDKAKINTTTSNVVDAYISVKNSNKTTSENAEILANKINKQETKDINLNAIVVLDTSGSMFGYISPTLMEKAMSIAYNIATHSSYAKDYVISFSSNPRLMKIKGKTLEQKYHSMYTGDCSNTDFGKVMNLLAELKEYPKYLIVLSDMEFDYGSNQSKEETMKIFKEHGAKTKIIWWNLNDRNQTAPEIDEYGNFYLGGYNLQLLNLIENDMNMDILLDEILKKYKKNIGI